MFTNLVWTVKSFILWPTEHGLTQIWMPWLRHLFIIRGQEIEDIPVWLNSSNTWFCSKSCNPNFRVAESEQES